MASQVVGRKACIVGGSGYLASWLVKLLLEKGYAVNATARDPDLEDLIGIENLSPATRAPRRRRQDKTASTPPSSPRTSHGVKSLTPQIALHCYATALNGSGYLVYEMVYLEISDSVVVQRFSVLLIHTAPSSSSAFLRHGGYSGDIGGNHNKTSHLIQLQTLGDLKIFRADLTDEDSFDAPIQGCEFVFHVATPINFASEDPENDMIKPAIQGVLNVLKACAKAKTVKRVVYTSSAGAVVINALQGPGLVMTEENWTDVDFLSSAKPPT